METKLVRVPFDVEMAKKITEGKVEGRIVTRGNYNARIICWDKQSDCHYNIIALIDCIGTEKISTYDANGCVVTGEKEANDLFLEVPEYLTFKDGDVIADDNGVIAIFKSVEIGRRRTFCLYAALHKGLLSFHDGSGWVLENAHKANEEEKKRIVEKLKESIVPQAKECLKRFFGIEKHSNVLKIGKDCDFNTFDKVLVRHDERLQWEQDSLIECMKEIMFVLIHWFINTAFLTKVMSICMEQQKTPNNFAGRK